ncbi:MAG: hypothetical protein H0W67_00570 [Gemmatimonadales bacterium]|nr:hypothetical protein [Gemmatimonadales bacterium]
MARVVALGLFLIGAHPHPLAAQESNHPWSLGLVAGAETFRGASHSSDPEIGGDASGHPSADLRLGLGLTRRLGPIEVGIEVTALSTYLEITAPSIMVQSRSQSFTRTRLMTAVGVPLTHVGRGALLVRLGPTVDAWALEGGETTTLFGGAGQLALRVPAGRLGVELGLGYAISESLFNTSDLPGGYERQSLRALSLETALRFGL